MPEHQMIVSLTVDELKQLIRESVTTAPPAYYSQDNSLLGHRRHLELCRSGKLQARRVGRSLFVRADELHRFIELAPPASAPEEAPKPRKKASKEPTITPKATPRRRPKSADELLARARSV